MSPMTSPVDAAHTPNNSNATVDVNTNISTPQQSPYIQSPPLIQTTTQQQQQQQQQQERPQFSSPSPPPPHSPPSPPPPSSPPSSSQSSHPLPSARPQQLEQLIAMGLQRARNSIDAKALVQATYDDDVFGVSSPDNDECQDMLVDVMNGMLDKITNSIVVSQPQPQNNNNNTNDNNNNTAIIIQTTTRERLETVDRIIGQILQQEAADKKHELDDKTTTQEALEEVLLPAGVTLEDVVRYQTYQRQVEERWQLQEQLLKLQAQVTELEQDVSHERESVAGHLEQMQTLAKELVQSADVCSMVH